MRVVNEDIGKSRQLFSRQASFAVSKVWSVVINPAGLSADVLPHGSRYSSPLFYSTAVKLFNRAAEGQSSSRSYIDFVLRNVPQSDRVTEVQQL